MEVQVSDIVLISKMLISGLVAAWVYQALVPVKQASIWERLIQALIFTLFINIGVRILQVGAFILGHVISIGIWDDSAETILTSVVALLFGCLFAYFTNNDVLHRYARKLRISTETSYTSEWYASFKNHITYIVVHLNDRRRILGWPREWPSLPGEGHFVLEDYSWLTNGIVLQEGTNENNEILSTGDFI